MRGFFVAGTDTGVGKTAITAALARVLSAQGFSVGVVKPVQSGNRAADPDGDAMLLRRLAGVEDAPEEICPYAFAAPLAPLVAARLEAREVDMGRVLTAVDLIAARHDVVLVEGAGGLLVPVGLSWTIADLALKLSLPLVIVARAGLGTVNHTLLTLEAARSRGLDVAAVVLNGQRADADESSVTNPDLIASFGDVAVVGPLPWLDGRIDEIVERLAEQLGVDPLLARLEREEAPSA
jgi:dethiobiotin synthetase